MEIEENRLKLWCLHKVPHFYALCRAYCRRGVGFPERDIWFLGTLEQGPAKWPEFLGRRRRRRRRRRHLGPNMSKSAISSKLACPKIPEMTLFQK